MAKKNDQPPKFPFDKMPYQEKGDSEEDESLEDFDLESDEELDIGESDKRRQKRTLQDEKGAGHEP